MFLWTRIDDDTRKLIVPTEAIEYLTYSAILRQMPRLWDCWRPVMRSRAQIVQSPKRTTVLLADDHAIVVEGLRHVLEPRFDVVGVVGDGLALVNAARELTPDVIVVDVSMP